jgi:putative acyl-CoA dehydrogenase
MNKKATIYSDFIQSLPKLDNEYLDDQFLQDYLRIYMPPAHLEAITPDLVKFGKLVASECIEWARDAELNNPELIQFDAWGNRIDKIIVSQGWLNLERAAAEEGLVAIGYERMLNEHSRLYQFTKLYLYTASSAIYTCPLAMTDGAARLIEYYGDDELKKDVFTALTSRNPEKFKTSGQWMTERTGGSDVSRSMTFATPDGDHYILKGHKWFTSAITADMAFTLASTEQTEPGKRVPLSLFYLPIRHEDGTLNGIEVEALKDKLGTRALPTAQLNLTGVKAKLVGEKGKGVKTIATLFNVTRIYNTISAVSYLRRAYALSKAYSKQREAFGQTIEQHPLHQKSLREMEIAYQSNTMLALFLARLLGKEDCKLASESEQALLRLLTPVAKLYTAKQAIQYASEHIEMFGGIGYLEDSGIPVMLRDVQTLSIWEGTTNVLSLDMLRAMEKENGLTAFIEFADSVLDIVESAELSILKKYSVKR